MGIGDDGSGVQPGALPGPAPGKTTGGTSSVSIAAAERERAVSGTTKG